MTQTNTPQKSCAWINPPLWADHVDNLQHPPELGQTYRQVSDGDNDMHTYYSESHILQCVAFEVGHGEAIALLG